VASVGEAAMSLLKYNLEQIWNQLRAKKPQFPQFLESVRIQNLRGIENLPINLSFPVTVVAGPNGCGKSTVLFACACAYDSLNKDFTPASMFPNLKAPTISDRLEAPSFEYSYYNNNSRLGMVWRRGKTWNKSFLGRKNAEQPRRTLYLRTLANLASPSEVRSILQIGSKNFEQTILEADLIAFAHRVLPFKYRKLSLLQFKNKDLLFADRADAETGYSEFHMSAGERAVLRISKDISRLKDSLILVDEIEAGLHPYTQQQVMLELERLSLRNNLQIVVTSHSAAVLESVPPEGRIFLERTDNNVTVQPPYRDIFQRAFYGQSLNKLSILCEDQVAEGLIMGVLDILNPKLNLTPDDIAVGRNTGKFQFAQHVEALGKFQLLDSFVLVLDGDARDVQPSIQQAAERFNRVLTPLYLPGDTPPEDWIYTVLENRAADYAAILGAPNLEHLLSDLRREFENASDRPTNIVKKRFETLLEKLRRTPTEIARIVGRNEAERRDMKIFSDALEQSIYNWRSRVGS
jgi:predicted ATPase